MKRKESVAIEGLYREVRLSDAEQDWSMVPTHQYVYHSECIENAKAHIYTARYIHFPRGNEVGIMIPNMIPKTNWVMARVESFYESKKTRGLDSVMYII